MRKLILLVLILPTLVSCAKGLESIAGQSNLGSGSGGGSESLVVELPDKTLLLKDIRVSGRTINSEMSLHGYSRSQNLQ